VDDLSNVYVSDYSLNLIKVFKAPLVSGTTVQSGSLGSMTVKNYSTINQPRQITLYPQTRELYIADSGNNRVLRYAFNATDPSLPNGVWGQANSQDTTCTNSNNITCLYKPTAVAVDCHNGVWIAAGSDQLATNYYLYYFPMGSSVATFALSAPLSAPNDWDDLWSLSFDNTCSRLAVTTGTQSSVYVIGISWFSNGTFQVVNNVTIFGGISSSGSNTDGTSDTISDIYSAAWDMSSGNLWVADYYNHRVVLLNPAMPIVSNSTRASTSRLPLSPSNSPVDFGSASPSPTNLVNGSISTPSPSPYTANPSSSPVYIGSSSGSTIKVWWRAIF